MQIDAGKVSEVQFEGAGCAISTSSASLMTEAIKGKTVAEAKELFERVRALMTGADGNGGSLGKLTVFEGVRDFPLRVKCATLAWHTMTSALAEQDEEVTTE